jgi:peptidoglycan/LPS O-acetylase OafA/YrhL
LIRKRAKRLLLPWLFWSALYAVLKVGDAIHSRHPISDEFHRWMLFAGPEIHLWYLPFAFIVTVLAALPWLRRSRLIGMGATRAWTIAGAVTLLLISWLLASQSLGPPWAQWAFVIPSVCFGVALSRVARGGAAWIGWAIAGAAVFGCAAAYSMGWGALAIPYAVGVIALALACTFNFAAGPWTLWLGGLAYGVYIVHPLFATCISRSSGVRDGTLLALSVAVASLVATAILKRTPLRLFI